MPCTKHQGCRIIFRRFRKDKHGKVMDAYHYGLRAWPMHVKV